MSSVSGYKVPLTKIKEIRVHQNAHSLEIATVFGFDVVVAKGAYEVGEDVVYIPIDSIIPLVLERAIFPPDAKIKLSKHRVKQIRIRKFPSQGMLISLSTIQMVYCVIPKDYDKDYAPDFKISKYEPPTRGNNFQGTAKKVKRKENFHFRKYNGLGNIKWFPDKFSEGEEVVVQEKIHGTNARAGILPFVANTWFQKLKGIFNLNPEFEFCYGSNNTQLQDRKFKGYYGEDVYGQVFESLYVKAKLKPNEVVFGEIYGSGIQKNYAYGCKEGEHRFALFDVQIDGVWLDPDAVIEFANDRCFDLVPEIYRGGFNVDKVKALTLGPSLITKKQTVREGVVIKALQGYDTGMGGKKALKFISEKYLDKEQTEFH